VIGLPLIVKRAVVSLPDADWADIADRHRHPAGSHGRGVGPPVGAGIEPPILVSANLDGSDARNQALLERYRDRLSYI
jgi:hypothetical protein